MRIYKKRKKINVIKQSIQKFIFTVLAFVGFFYLLNLGIDRLSVADWFLPKTITVLNKAAASDLLPQEDMPVPAGIYKSGETEPKNSVESLIEQYFGSEAPTALAVARAESSLNPEAQNINKNGTKDLGIFQLNDCHGWSERERLDAETNIRLAKQLRDKSGWENWSVFNSGVYLKFIN